MKLKNVKIGVRVEAKKAIDGRILKGAKGTILQSDNEEPFIEWDNFADGHSRYNPTVPDSSWAVEIQYLRRLKD